MSSGLDVSPLLDLAFSIDVGWVLFLAVDQARLIDRDEMIDEFHFFELKDNELCTLFYDTLQVRVQSDISRWSKIMKETSQNSMSLSSRKPFLFFMP